MLPDRVQDRSYQRPNEQDDEGPEKRLVSEPERIGYRRHQLAFLGVEFQLAEMPTRIAERLAAWSVRWARAEIRTDISRVSQFNAVRSHAERMASLEDGRSLHDALERTGADVVGVAAPAPPREFADVARFCRLEALWELAQVKSR